MRDKRTKPWRRLSCLRASRRRHTELEPPTRADDDEPLPPLESPDDDREFLPHPQTLLLGFVPIPRPEHA